MKKICCCLLAFCLASPLFAQPLEELWRNPGDDARPWVYWYWVFGAVSRESVTADLEAMKEVGVGGAYLFTIGAVPDKDPYVIPSYDQFSPGWWEMVDYAVGEAERLGLALGLPASDGWALAGGPWITPELSMQKVVWAQARAEGGGMIRMALPTPDHYGDYYRDIAVYAYPALPGEGLSTETIRPVVTTSQPGTDASFLTEPGNCKVFRSDSACWIQYAFDASFLCRTVCVTPRYYNYQPQRLTIEASDDGFRFREVVRLVPPRQGWQRSGATITHAIPPTRARFFRFRWDAAGSEPGVEDMDAAKWTPLLDICGIRLSSEVRIHQFEAKNGEAWRLGAATTSSQLDDGVCLDPERLVDITDCVDSLGRLVWQASVGDWTILRMGYTSTGSNTAHSGKGGSGLECDKFNPDAVRLQFDSWVGEFFRKLGPERASCIVKMFHVDSWECGSQNWSPVFRKEFAARRGYDLVKYLPVMAGIPLHSAELSECVLYDVRRTITELTTDNFFGVMQQQAHAKGCSFSAECVAPVMMCDGMLHYKYTDYPMGEFWLQSKTHDKPNDILDAVSGARAYGKNIVQAEAFTQRRIVWNEHPRMLKALQDTEFALGVNRFVFHVYTHSPWLDRQPGMTLNDGIGLFFCRDQTWWKPGRAWVDYTTRCQALLQYGDPVADIAVFTGEALPARAVLPEKLVPFLPGLFGADVVAREEARMANKGTPMVDGAAGKPQSAHITDALDWVNALRGYRYDCINPDALLGRAKAEHGRMVMPDGRSYGALVIPGRHAMQPDPDRMSAAVAAKITELAAAGVPVLIGGLPTKTLGMETLGATLAWPDSLAFVRLPYRGETLDAIGLPRDFIVTEPSGGYAGAVNYEHRRSGDADIYFIANQSETVRDLRVSMRICGRSPELWYPADGRIETRTAWRADGRRTVMPLRLEPLESVFVVLRTDTSDERGRDGDNTLQLTELAVLSVPWSVDFEGVLRTRFESLTAWDEHADERIRHYSGTATYRSRFDLPENPDSGTRYFLALDDVADLAEVRINGEPCGIVWTRPYRVEIGGVLRRGRNDVEIEVTNTWANRMIGEGRSKTPSVWTNARYKAEGMPLQKSGLTGKVHIVKEIGPGGAKRDIGN